jgi:hypothetical protein
VAWALCLAVVQLAPVLVLVVQEVPCQAPEWGQELLDPVLELALVLPVPLQVQVVQQPLRACQRVAVLQMVQAAQPDFAAHSLTCAARRQSTCHTAPWAVSLLIQTTCACRSRIPAVAAGATLPWPPLLVAVAAVQEGLARLAAMQQAPARGPALQVAQAVVLLLGLLCQAALAVAVGPAAPTQAPVGGLEMHLLEAGGQAMEEATGVLVLVVMARL